MTFTPPTLNGPVNTIIQFKIGANAGKYLIGGSFTSVNGNSAYHHVARLNADGTHDTGFTSPTLNSAVNSAGDPFICGNGDGTAAATTDVRALVEVQTASGSNTAGKIYIGGNFLNASTPAGTDQKMDYLIRVNASGGDANTGFYPTVTGLSTGSVSFGNCVNTIFTGEGTGAGRYLIVGLQGNARVSKRVFDTGAVVSSFAANLPAFEPNVGTGKPVTTGFYCTTAMGCPGNRYVIGGDFANVGGNTKLANLVRLNTDGIVCAHPKHPAVMLLQGLNFSVVDRTRWLNARYRVGLFDVFPI
ncbi:MAG: delta-60 repeat domain-containing protein [Chromatiaceae bacterium]|nr:delta-60 repeat domain-containing protein [Chromatiaceae bacterium]